MTSMRLRVRDHARRQRVDVVLPDRDIRERRRERVHDLVPQHHRVLQRVRLRGAGQQLSRPRPGEAERVANHPLDAHPREKPGLLGHLVRGAAMQTAAEPGVLALAVLPHAYHVDVLRCPADQRARHARHQSHRPQVHVLLESLADRQDQLPHRDVIGDRRMADRAEIDRVGVAKPIEPVGRHHAPGLAVVVAAPRILDTGDRQTGEVGNRGEHAHRRRRHLLADAVAGDHGDAVTGAHDYIPGGVKRPSAASQPPSA